MAKASIAKAVLFWLLLAVIPIAAFLAGLAWVSYWSVPRFPIRVAGGSIISYDPEIGFVPTPNAGVTRTDNPALSYRIYTDRRGARVSHRAEQSADKLDIMFVGDSFTWGAGVENDKTYAALVARGLNLRSANLAMASYGTTQALQMLRRNLGAQPRTVIYPVNIDHWRRNVSMCAPNYYPFCLDYSYVTVGAAGLPEIHPPGTNGVRRLDLQVEYETKGLAPAQWVVHGADVVVGRILAKAAEQRASDLALQNSAMRFLLSEMAKTTNGIGASLDVVFIPAGEQMLPAPVQLTELGHALGFGFLDLTQSMRAHGGRQLYLPDGHPNELGHQLIANDIMNFISDRK